MCITGQVPTHLIGSDAFQECDTTGITRSCTKHNYLVRRVEDLPRILHEAFYIASHGRPGPVVVDIPKDVQFASGVYAFQKNIQHKTYRPQLKGDLERDQHADRDDGNGAKADLLHRRRRHQFRPAGFDAVARARAH